jgi:tetratricopeptide (TPR) repeat protein
VENGIWLCQDDAKHVDDDPSRYTADVLRQWKAEAEDRAHQMLTHRLATVSAQIELDIPAIDTVDSLLSFANTRMPCFGRAVESGELKDFLDSDAPFSWWLWTGPAGVGKSRLAAELCRSAGPEWRAGFLREGDQSVLGDLRTLRPTLVVVDYASQRSAWLSEALAQLSRRKLGAKVRVLILERQASGLWWDTVQRPHRMAESAEIAATMYALPRELPGLNREDSREVIFSMATQLGRPDLTSTQVEDIADRANELDPENRPLFFQLSTIDWLDAQGASAGRDKALRRLISRSFSAMTTCIGDTQSAALARNVQVLATSLGGLDVEAYAEFIQVSEVPNSLLPDIFRDFGSITLDDLLRGVRPDIVGELFVLDEIAAADAATRLATQLLLGQASLANPDAYRAFVERTAADHSEHPRLIALLGAASSDESPLWSLELGISVIPLLRRSDHPAIGWVFERLQETADSAGSESVGQLRTIGQFHVANLVLNESDSERAYGLYTAALDACDPSWPEYSSILNNRGAASLLLGRPMADAIADFTAVIDSLNASDESRACALNNRADLTFPDDPAGSIADRSSVLALADTTFNRRYIALTRRADAYRHVGNNPGAFDDIQLVLETPDIAVEQKMHARLTRAGWFIESGEYAKARHDLEAIVSSRRNFHGVAEAARRLIRDELQSG